MTEYLLDYIFARWEAAIDIFHNFFKFTDEAADELIEKRKNRWIHEETIFISATIAQLQPVKADVKSLLADLHPVVKQMVERMEKKHNKHI